ncbi:MULTISPECIES: acyl-CoA dehydrogenase family protein [unclassified Chelatococcus]|uniref:acyl-CoA dehydrogenase family protein n=1 Tax=unclassified Chelatococcus TaxID=2638111 RepID=UPI001BCFB31F|nr:MULTISPECIES: acyl-CoA dehydrogenase family protein [unclassified Chelatococcus]MBS7700226.1 acyl-CoA dehydrogenase family protein [Chelatococcus sp. YT9]MBX3558197.1 acyl-CoA dehydrogenase family protein [Chelatococcus sp.]
MTAFRLFPDPASPAPIHDAASALRAEVRAFLDEERARGAIRPGRQSWTTWDRSFSERAAARGYVGMTLPVAYGGGGRSALERYVVCEEMLAAGAPLGSHWIADRQSGPQILRHGSDEVKRAILPEIAAGRITFGIGMSEPDSGSDLSSIRTRADRVAGGFRVEGRKVWTTNAQHAEFIICLCRTEPRGDDRYAGLSQLVVPMKQPAITVRPLINLAGEHELNEITFDGAFVPEDHLLGSGGDGWKLVTEELAFERSGPDRFLSTFTVLSTLAEALRDTSDRHGLFELGVVVSRLTAIRQLSLQINALLGRGEGTGALAMIMKDLGTALEQDIPEIARRVLDLRPSMTGDRAAGALATAILNAPCFSLRGGTREILKGIIARELGLR